ncbi:hypothetical protein LJB90_02180 [Eubacteriales bacterium OttesenSCG-928-G02]|nr:hypothetical protein [Eubacteriales bacterium OttesenSCG-928-G02]
MGFMTIAICLCAALMTLSSGYQIIIGVFSAFCGVLLAMLLHLYRVKTLSFPMNEKQKQRRMRVISAFIAAAAAVGFTVFAAVTTDYIIEYVPRSANAVIAVYAAVCIICGRFGFIGVARTGNLYFIIGGIGAVVGLVARLLSGGLSSSFPQFYLDRIDIKIILPFLSVFFASILCIEYKSAVAYKKRLVQLLFGVIAGMALWTLLMVVGADQSFFMGASVVNGAGFIAGLFGTVKLADLKYLKKKQPKSADTTPIKQEPSLSADYFISKNKTQIQPKTKEDSLVCKIKKAIKNRLKAL